jgi:hypothetical protein
MSSESPSSDVTRLLVDWQNGSAGALDQLMPLINRLRDCEPPLVAGTQRPHASEHVAHHGPRQDDRVGTCSGRTARFLASQAMMRRIPVITHATSIA